jgi:hypothetical protein
VAGERYLRLTVPKNPDATDVQIVVEITSDLLDPNAWTSEPLIIENESATQLQVRDTIPVNQGSPRQMRVRVVLNP